jgi:hypothetical protein
MKKISTLVLLMLAALTTTKLYAQSSDDYKKFTLGIGLEGALPVSGINNVYSVGGGATLRATIGLDKTSAITLTSGVIAFIPKSLGGGVDLKAEINIPVKAGYKYMLSDHVYAIGEAGMTFAKVYASAGGQLVSATGSNFTYAPGIGIQFGGFDTSLRYEGYSGAGFLGVRVGFNF